MKNGIKNETIEGKNEMIRRDGNEELKGL
jgi:hypothetical protein